MAKVVLALGANLGNPIDTFRKSISMLEDLGIKDIVSSSIYRTSSLLLDSQPDYLNMVLLGETELSPIELLRSIKDIELKLGRIDIGRWRERIIDIDIIDYDSVVMQSASLTLPHPGMEKRSFVLFPLLEIYPNYKHPLIDLPLESIYSMLDNKLDIHIFSKF